MQKAVITIHYQDYVMDMEDALKYVEILNRAERFSKEKGTYWVWPNEEHDLVSIRLMSDDLYLKAKLAGEPTK